MIDKRKVNHLYTQEIMEYRINGNNPGENFLTGVTHDLSKSGARIYLMDEVHFGDKIALAYSSVSFRETAVVKWVKKIQDGFYIAGMMFA